MAVSRVHNWISLEALSASDLNAEFNNLVTYANRAVLTDAAVVTGASITVGTGAATTNFLGASSGQGVILARAVGLADLTIDSGGNFRLGGTTLSVGTGSATSIICGAANAQAVTISRNSGLNDLQIDAGGTFFMNAAVKAPSIGTTASAANLFVDNAASNNFLRSTSSLAVKADLRPITVSEARRIVRALNPFSYRSKATADDPKRRFYGLGAEHVAEVTDMLVHPDKDGKPDGVMYDRVGVVNLVMTQNHDWRLRVMEIAVWVMGIALVASWMWR